MIDDQYHLLIDTKLKLAFSDDKISQSTLGQTCANSN